MLCELTRSLYLVYWTDNDRQSDDELPCKNFFLSTGK